MSSRLHQGESVQAEPISWPTVEMGQSSVQIPFSEPGAYRPTASAGPKSGQLETEIEQRVRAAYARGREEGQLSAQQELRGTIERLGHSIDEITGLRQRLRHEAEEDVVKLAIAIARRILHRELTVSPEALLGLAKAALEKIDSRELHKIRLHPENAPMLQAYLEKMGLPRRVEVTPDPRLERGAVILETTRGMFDASIETQLGEIERGFADLVRHAP